MPCLTPLPGPLALPLRCLSDFALNKQLYKGKASTLYQATDKVSGTVVALKSYSKRRLSDLNWYQVERGERAGRGRCWAGPLGNDGWELCMLPTLHQQADELSDTCLGCAEIRLHSQLRHPHIIQLYAAFEDDNYVFMVTEFAAGGWQAARCGCGRWGSLGARFANWQL